MVQGGEGAGSWDMGGYSMAVWSRGVLKGGGQEHCAGSEGFKSVSLKEGGGSCGAGPGTQEDQGKELRWCRNRYGERKHGGHSLSSLL